MAVKIGTRLQTRSCSYLWEVTGSLETCSSCLFLASHPVLLEMYSSLAALSGNQSQLQGVACMWRFRARLHLNHPETSSQHTTLELNEQNVGTEWRSSQTSWPDERPGSQSSSCRRPCRRRWPRFFPIRSSQESLNEQIKGTAPMVQTFPLPASRIKL